MFDKAKWIWNSETKGTDCYAEFLAECEFQKNDSVSLKISVDSNYALYLNGQFVESGQYADYPHYKVYDEIDLSDYVVDGTNHLAFIVWYYGVPSSTYYIGKPGILFEIEKNGKVVLWSDENVKSRRSRRYISGKNEMITPQLGLNFHVDLGETDDWMTDKGVSDFETSIVMEDMPQQLFPREIKKLVIEPRIPMELNAQGVFQYLSGEEIYGKKMQHAALSFFRFNEMAKKDGDAVILEKETPDGIYFVVDLQSETAGYLDFDLEVPEDCQMEVGWGEHLEDGRCRTDTYNAGFGRNFSVTVQLQKGRNSYMNPFRRLGCRYIQFFIHSSKVMIHYAGLRPTLYPLNVRKYECGNILRDRIYEICQNTLRQCMHEHYEDCPWREQAFYTLDSRNQMLCGYYAFGEYEFPRKSLKLISKSVREDGTLPICYPASSSLCIPSFMLFYIMQLAEYYQYTKDAETIKECFDCAKTIIDVYCNQIDETGLAVNFDKEKDFWNFYEWQPYLDGEAYKGKAHDMCLNALFSLAIDSFAELCHVMGMDAKGYLVQKEKLNQRIIEEFYDENAGLFRICDREEVKGFSVLANALGYLCGAAKQLDCTTILKVILDNGAQDMEQQVIPTSLSMDTFRYEALLMADKEHYKDAILNEIDQTYFDMLQKGATSFWETKDGDKDFDYAGSLCHGWSAMAIYYYETLIEQ